MQSWCPILQGYKPGSHQPSFLSLHSNTALMSFQLPLHGRTSCTPNIVVARTCICHLCRHLSTMSTTTILNRVAISQTTKLVSTSCSCTSTYQQDPEQQLINGTSHSMKECSACLSGHRPHQPQRTKEHKATAICRATKLHLALQGDRMRPPTTTQTLPMLLINCDNVLYSHAPMP